MAATPMTAAMVTAAWEATAAKIEPKDAHPFRMDDAVVYPAHRVGRVERVGFEEIVGHRLNLIHISFDDNQMTLCVPVAHARREAAQACPPREPGRSSCDVERPPPHKPAYVGRALSGVSG